MSDNEDKITQLEMRVDLLVRTQVDFQQEITSIRREISRLRGASRREGDTLASAVRNDAHAEKPADAVPVPEPVPSPRERVETDDRGTMHSPAPTFGYSYAAAGESEKSAFESRVADYTANARADLEKFIGENLISKIGIIILIIGVGIGVKYSIDNELISPLARIIVGYGFGFGLVGLAIKLKRKYHNFSAALISGGMAIMYFVTYFAFSLYELIPQSSAFALMGMFTVFTVAAAVFYSRQVIAHIGLVGAYAVPFLLSSDSGNYLMLFSYMAVVNSGILAIALKKQWTPVFYTASAFTWLIFFGWFISRYSGEHLYLALTFVGIFTAIFFATKLVHASMNDSTDDEDLAGVVGTALIFYGFAYAIGNNVTAPLHDPWVFFAFLAIFSAVFLAVSVGWFGRVIVYVVFVATWFTYGVWFSRFYDEAGNLPAALVFAIVFFVMFYGFALADRLIYKRSSAIENAGIILTSSFLFYGFGYLLVDGQTALQNYLGLFTAAHAGLHLIIAGAVSRVRRDAIDVVQVLTILILTFASIAVPVQFDGNFVTMIWAAEAVFLFWMGRRNAIPIFEHYSLPMMVLAVASLTVDWSETAARLSPQSFNMPLANGDLIGALVVAAAFVGIYKLGQVYAGSALPADVAHWLGVAAAGIAVAIVYNAFRIEIFNYFYMRGLSADGSSAYALHGDLAGLNFIWQLVYTMGFLGVIAGVNLVRVRSRLLAAVNVLLASVPLLIYSTAGMLALFFLRDTYLIAGGSYMNIGVRYVLYAAAGVLLFAIHRYRLSDLLPDSVSQGVKDRTFEGVLVSVVFITASCELLHLMVQFDIPDGGKLGLSILWGVYALGLIAIGIAQSKKHLRIAAIILLAVTLVKLFFYDAADLDTIPKTILFVTLGITLLITSFLYNKYKEIIFGSGPMRADERLEDL